jgi:hypothetical protein
VFLADRQCVLGRAGQAHYHLSAEVKCPVVPAAVGNGLNRETCPPRELLSDQTAHLPRVNANALRHGTKIWCVTQRGILSGKATELHRRVHDRPKIASVQRRIIDRCRAGRKGSVRLVDTGAKFFSPGCSSARRRGLRR